MIFSRLGNIELEKRASHRVGSSDFIFLNPLKTFFVSSSVSDVLMMKIYLNFPTQIYWASDKKIDYIYNAAGIKVKKTVRDGNTIKIIDYLDGFQYAGGELQFFPTAEGYVKATPLSGEIGGATTSYLYNYVYNYTDHLGNIRMSYSKDPATNELKILDESHYYPFGLKHSVYAASTPKDFKESPGGGGEILITNVVTTSYQFKYNGFEYQDELGLNWYDYMARNYDPALGRWFNMDPLAEVSRKYSPYTYALDNPVYFIDPDGMMASNGYQDIDTESFSGSMQYSNFDSGDDLIVTGADANQAVQELSQDSAMNLSRSNSTGQVLIDNIENVDYSSLDSKDQRLYDIITDPEKTVNLSTTRDMIRTDSNGNQSFFILGAYNGQTMNDGFQEVNMTQALNLENGGGNTAGTIVRHEIDESYSAMEIVRSTPTLNPTRNVYTAAHNNAQNNDPSHIVPTGNQLYHDNSANVLWYNNNPNATPTSNGWFILQK